MKLEHIVKHTVIGAVSIGTTHYLVKKYLETRDDLNEEQKASILGAADGAAAGGNGGYFVADVVIDGKVPDSKKNKVCGTIGGALLVGLVGYVTGKKIGQKKMYYSSQQKAGEQTNKQQGGGA